MSVKSRREQRVNPRYRRTVAALAGIGLAVAAISVFQSGRRAGSGPGEPFEPNAAQAAAEEPRWPGIGKSVTIGETRVALVGARIERPLVKTARVAEYEFPESALVLRVRVHNLSKTRVLNYSTWRNTRRTVLHDEHGADYRGKLLPGGLQLVGEVDYERVGPGASVSDVVLFERPVESATRFEVDLPNPAGGPNAEPFRFAFTRDQLK